MWLRTLIARQHKPTDTRRVLEATYVLDQIGVDLLPANVENIYRSLLDRVGGGGTALMKTVTDALAFLVDKTFVREVGSGENVIFRFLKAYQRKIEEDVRLQNPPAQLFRIKRASCTTALKQLVPTQRASSRLFGPLLLGSRR